MAARGARRRTQPARLHGGWYVAWAALLIDVVLVAGHRTGPRAIGRDEPRAPDAPSILGRSRWRLTSDEPIDLETLDQILVDTTRKVRRWLDWSDDREVPRCLSRVFLCRDLNSLIATERSNGFGRAYGYRDSLAQPGRTFEPRGGFYRPLGMIALVAEAFADLRVLIAHEVTHAVLEDLLPDIPDFLNEGMAEVVAPWIVFGDGDHPLDRDVLNVRHAGTCGRAAVEGRVPALEYLAGLDYWEFRADAKNDEHYALSWAFVRAAAGRGEAPLGGSLFDLIGAMGSAQARSPIAALRAVYPIPVTGNDAWRRELTRYERFAPWRVPAGNWWLTEDGVIGTTRSAGTALLLGDRPFAGTDTISASFRLTEPLGPHHAVGFVVGYRDLDNYVVLQIGPELREVVAFARVEQRWAEVASDDLPRGLDLTGATIGLELDGQRARITADGEWVASLPIERELIVGRVGVVAEGLAIPRDTPVEDAGSRALRFTEVAVDGERLPAK